MLEEYKDTLAAVAGVLTIGQMFSGAFLCNDIRKAGSSKNFPCTPFVGGVVFTILFAQHGRLMNDAALGFVNFIGMGINLAYVLFYVAYSGSDERAKLLKEMSIGAGVLSVMLGYSYIEDPSVVATRFGLVITALMFFLISAPLFSIKKIIETRNTDQIPFPMVVSGIAVGCAWMLYGIAAHLDFVVYQNLLMLTVSMPQLVLCLLFRKEKKS